MGIHRTQEVPESFKLAISPPYLTAIPPSLLALLIVIGVALFTGQSVRTDGEGEENIHIC